MKLKTLINTIIVAGVLTVSTVVSAAGYADVPDEHWATAVINEAAEAGIMYGRDDGTFGLGDTVKRSEFAAMLVRLMKWDKSVSAISLFSDVQSDKWYFADINTLADHNVFNEKEFRPNDNITRREMAVMLVKALGYSELAQSEISSIFNDVSTDEGYISVAYTLGIINGKSDTMFDPEGPALREEGAAMMMRMYNKYYSSLNEIHGFYAISSWGQKEMAAQMDSVSFGWSRLQYTDDNVVLLNQTSDGGNDWCVPDGSQNAIDYMRENGVSINLAVTMTDTEDCNVILLNSENRSEAIRQILSASDNFDGITIDFEGMKGTELKEGLNEFVKELKTMLGNKKLYIAVHPVLKHSNEYFDAYDYKTLGDYADRIILMAHDYAAYTLPDNLINTNFIATPVTPFDEVFTALKAITNPIIGVSDKSKIQLAISTASTTAWNTTDKRITDNTAIHPSIDTVQKRLAQNDTEITYSQAYKNPYAFYNTESNQQILLWYEDSRSVKDKINLAKMFGIKSVSIWRIGTVANGNSEQYMDIWNTIISEYQN
ncbi:MAG: S-layer homology domain-containing protein [Acutalibacteraceae bacterium]|nr:S-layer homology domain-containing protein [Acutalibacteraceae bacterium]